MHIYYNDLCLKHTPPPDPEFAPNRILNVIRALHDEKFKNLHWRNAPSLPKEDLYLAHTPEYVSDVLSPMKPDEERDFSSDTVAVAGTADAALSSAGLVMTAMKDVVEGKIQKAFCLTSPGGHHAEADAALGFCFFNNLALAAITALKKEGIKRVAVVDFDAHPANGTQSLFWNFEERLLISLHEENHLSGYETETGAWHNILNIPLPKNSPGIFVREAYLNKALPKLQSFKPEILFVSAGFDMHADDPLSSMRLSTDDYRWFGEALRVASNNLCQRRLVAVLEGGYNLDVLGGCVAAFVSGIEAI